MAQLELGKLEPPSPENVKRIALTIDHRSILEAFVADVIDLIPVVGEITGFVKGQDAAKKGNSMCAAALTGDIFLADIVPANTLCYLISNPPAGLPRLPKNLNLPELLPNP